VTEEVFWWSLFAQLIQTTNVQPPQSVVISQYTSKPVQLDSGSIVYIPSVALGLFVFISLHYLTFGFAVASENASTYHSESWRIPFKKNSYFHAGSTLFVNSNHSADLSRSHTCTCE